MAHSGSAYAKEIDHRPKNIIVDKIYRTALGRPPTPVELAAAGDMAKTEEGVEDLLWAIVMLPEFQLVR